MKKLNFNNYIVLDNLLMKMHEYFKIASPNITKII